MAPSTPPSESPAGMEGGRVEVVVGWVAEGVVVVNCSPCLSGCYDQRPSSAVRRRGSEWPSYGSSTVTRQFDFTSQDCWSMAALSRAILATVKGTQVQNVELVLDLDGSVVVGGRLQPFQCVLHAVHQALCLDLLCLVGGLLPVPGQVSGVVGLWQRGRKSPYKSSSQRKSGRSRSGYNLSESSTAHLPPHLGPAVSEAVLQDGVVTLRLPGEGVGCLLATVGVASHFGVLGVPWGKIKIISVYQEPWPDNNGVTVALVVLLHLAGLIDGLAVLAPHHLRRWPGVDNAHQLHLVPLTSAHSCLRWREVANVKKAEDFNMKYSSWAVHGELSGLLTDTSPSP
ncbi:hypothetical protein E2C01_018053 [Portunus trituberculatus]|uniref:Uncharacterized protein n=1 Tax=Portunus trituberculatus TaxID=210409 RepID=A0A5B7DV66_PORTR|nr:hypothetical protein [Portunus trituberculatus]